MQRTKRNYTFRTRICICCGIKYGGAIRYDSLSRSSTCRSRLSRKGIRAIDLYRAEWFRNQEILRHNLLVDDYGWLIARVLILIQALIQQEGRRAA
jgi:hypothetical protein